MFQNIVSEEDFDFLREGSFVIQYPISLAPRDEIDLSDEDAFILYEVREISITRRLLILAIPEQPHLNNHESIHSHQPGKKIVLNKHQNDIIRESVWWYRREDLLP